MADVNEYTQHVGTNVKFMLLYSCRNRLSVADQYRKVRETAGRVLMAQGDTEHTRRFSPSLTLSLSSSRQNGFLVSLRTPSLILRVSHFHFVARTDCQVEAEPRVVLDMHANDSTAIIATTKKKHVRMTRLEPETRTLQVNT